ncbi:hypothetical protein FVE85_8138 [Porphyridium purpureum]|uniref:Uncharacterized protein n=1 Tax=Porphyridium purpureum TaxID=35688 RepID=A0A5J4YMC1_PORPP|nr:hypothetical protein FVE85_8138 [Porphyridium purpureum]|eukprot:POR4192..scf295_9
MAHVTATAAPIRLPPLPQHSQRNSSQRSVTTAWSWSELPVECVARIASYLTDVRSVVLVVWAVARCSRSERAAVYARMAQLRYGVDAAWRVMRLLGDTASGGIGHPASTAAVLNRMMDMECSLRGISVHLRAIWSPCLGFDARGLDVGDTGASRMRTMPWLLSLPDDFPSWRNKAAVVLGSQIVIIDIVEHFKDAKQKSVLHEDTDDPSTLSNFDLDSHPTIHDFPSTVTHVTFISPGTLDGCLRMLVVGADRKLRLVRVFESSKRIGRRSLVEKVASIMSQPSDKDTVDVSCLATMRCANDEIWVAIGHASGAGQLMKWGSTRASSSPGIMRLLGHTKRMIALQFVESKCGCRSSGACENTENAADVASLVSASKDAVRVWVIPQKQSSPSSNAALVCRFTYRCPDDISCAQVRNTKAGCRKCTNQNIDESALIYLGTYHGSVRVLSMETGRLVSVLQLPGAVMRQHQDEDSRIRGKRPFVVRLFLPTNGAVVALLATGECIYWSPHDPACATSGRPKVLAGTLRTIRMRSMICDDLKICALSGNARLLSWNLDGESLAYITVPFDNEIELRKSSCCDFSIVGAGTNVGSFLVILRTDGTLSAADLREHSLQAFLESQRERNKLAQSSSSKFFGTDMSWE